MNISKFTIFICLSIMYSLASFAEGKMKSKIIIENFDSIPSDIDGGCCVFYRYSNTIQNDSYIMVNNLANTAYMVINHHLEEFTLVANRKNIYWYKNNKYTLKVKIVSTQSKDQGECYDVKGTLTVEDFHKNKESLFFSGNCSW